MRSTSRVAGGQGSNNSPRPVPTTGRIAMISCDLCCSVRGGLRVLGECRNERARGAECKRCRQRSAPLVLLQFRRLLIIISIEPNERLLTQVPRSRLQHALSASPTHSPLLRQISLSDSLRLSTAGWRIAHNCERSPCMIDNKMESLQTFAEPPPNPRRPTASRRTPLKPAEHAR